MSKKNCVLQYYHAVDVASFFILFCLNFSSLEMSLIPLAGTELLNSTLFPYKATHEA